MNILTKESLQTQFFTYEGIMEYNNFRIIAGYEDRINYEGKEVHQAMHAIIYNTTTKEIIYNSGNNLFLENGFLLVYADTLLKLVEKYINDSWNLNKLLDSFFYDFSFFKFDRIKKQFENEEIEAKKQIEQTAIENENTELENELKGICINNELKLIKSFTRMYIVKFKDKRCNKTISTTDTLIKIINDESYKNEYKIIYSNNNTCDCKDYNIALKEAIKICS